MPAISALSPSEWQEVRSAVESGVSYEQAANRFGVEAVAIRSRACRQNWLTPSKVDKAVENLRLQRNATEGAKVTTAIEVAAATYEENVQKLKMKGVEWGANVAEYAADNLTRPGSAKEAAQAIMVAAKLAGIGQESAVNVNLWGGLAGVQIEGGAVREAEIVECEDDTGE